MVPQNLPLVTIAIAMRLNQLKSSCESGPCCNAGLPTDLTCSFLSNGQ